MVITIIIYIDIRAIQHVHNCVVAMNSISDISYKIFVTPVLRPYCDNVASLNIVKRQGTRSRVLQRRNNAAASSSSSFHFSAFTQRLHGISSALSARP